MIEHGCNGAQLVDAVRELQSMVGDLRVRVDAIAPRASYGSGMIDAIEDFAPVPRADADTAGEAVDIKQIAHEVSIKCTRIPGANFYTAAEMALDAVKAAPRADAHTAGAKPCEYCDVNYPYHDLDCPVSIAALAKKAYEAEYGASNERADAKPCTCHPDDNPPKPCPKKYALNECRADAEKEK